jgi:uncharacterized protein (DUF736 family)
MMDICRKIHGISEGSIEVKIPGFMITIRTIVVTVDIKIVVEDNCYDRVRAFRIFVAGIIQVGVIFHHRRGLTI